MEEHGREPRKDPIFTLPKRYHCPTHGSGNNPSCCDECAPMTQDEFVNDPVNHPAHYTMYQGLEIIDLTEQMNFNKGNAVKYIARAGFKGGPEKEIEDLKKAQWYISREIDRLEGNPDDIPSP